MKELALKVDSAPARLEANFEELRIRLQEELQKYDVVVTADTVADAKKLATELNKTRQHIDQRRKDEVAKVSAPIREFDDRMNELAGLCKDGRQGLLDQIRKFEDDTRELVRAQLDERRTELWMELVVDDEFQRATFDDLVLVSNLTAGGNVTAKARGALYQRVRDDK
ncbi:MAG TPA: DUF1351 domain-containing protein, partial [Gammaproteobacteria bacterium]|nr:DUF1351 domain-containing protein [Gammaproteobacteria bacterium]